MSRREITWTSAFKRDFKRGKKKFAQLEFDLASILSALAEDRGLTANWKPNRKCHVRTDLVLIYQQPDDNTLLLVRLGSHSELNI